MNSHSSRRTCRLALAIFVGSLAPAHAAEPNYNAFDQVAYLGFLNARGGIMRRPPSLAISFGERFHRATLDTGSTGVVVGATSIPNVDQLLKISDGQLTYTSSGRVMRGRWVRTAFTIMGSENSTVQTEVMPVLAVDHVDCLPRARDCNPNEDVGRIAMIGVGFAREGDRQGQSTPDKNPFLHVVSKIPHQRRGYVVTADGVHIGLSGPNTAGPFTYVKLERNSSETDWSPVQACISINGQEPAACGTLLVDTGVKAAFMTVPKSQVSGTRLQPGDQVAVSLVREHGVSPLYAFRVGGESPLAPETVHLRVSPHRTFLNTSCHFLNGFDFLYDADGGYAGFRTRGAGEHAVQ